MLRRDLLKTLGAAAFVNVAFSESSPAQSAANAQANPLNYQQEPIPALQVPETPAGSATDLAKDEQYWESIRKMFILDAKAIPMANGFGGFTPQAILDEVARLASDAAHMKALLYLGRQESGPSAPLSRLMAQDFGADPEEVTLNRNASEGLATVLFGLDLRRGDEVLLNTQEYGGSFDILRQREAREGIKTRTIKLPLPSISAEDIVTRLEGAITPMTRALVICHIFSNSGEIMPIADICRMAHRHGVFVLVDGAHGPGQIPFNLHALGCDAYVASLHKWFMAPRGTGMIYIRKDRIPDIWPHTYWERDVPRGSIEKFESYGTVDLSVPASLPMVFEFNRALTYAKKEARLRYLRQRWVSQLSSVPRVRILTNQSPAFTCAMSAFQVEGADPEKLWLLLLRKYHVRTRAFVEDEDPQVAGLTVGASLINSLADCDRLVDAVSKATQSDV